ncbi:ATP-binding protein [Acinetobacter pittii]|uniref:ATP-binding protein n=1 Tax=Acinetobacter pittii TaxID=48296 RepID=UPI0032617271
MKRLNTEKIILQKKKNLKILRVNLKIKNQKKFFKRTAKKIYSEILNFTGQLAIFKAVNRAELLDNIKKIQNWTINDKPLYLDFSKLTRLDACSTSLFVHNLNKYQNVNMKGKASKKNVVRSMLTKLGVHQKLGLKNYYCNQAKVNKWCIAKGTNSDLTNGYEVIENVLMDHFSLENEEFYIINEAISEAINNVVDHAYEFGDSHKEWLAFVAIDEKKCSVVISDLGKTIPVSVPRNVKDKSRAALAQLLKLDLKDWGRINDAQRIQLASSFRKTATELKHRGKGFANMMEVCKQVAGSELYVYSRKGLWAMTNNGKKHHSQVFNRPINGTIIYWDIPLNRSLMGNSMLEAA